MDIYSQWSKGNYGKGYISDGFVTHWNVDSSFDGSPHHFDKAVELGDDPAYIKRFDISKDGQIQPIVECLADRFDEQDLEAVFNAHPLFHNGQNKSSGYGHAEALMNISKS